MSQTWVVPGAPLLDGSGWRIWYSRPGNQDFLPTMPTALRNGSPQAITTTWDLLPRYEGLDRRMGVLDVRLAQPLPGQTFDIIIPETPMRQYRWKSLPNSVAGGVSFVLASCYWLPNDKEGSYGAGIRDLDKIEQPAFKLLVGDQVYQDWPPNLSPKDPVARFAQRYDQYWGHPAYQEVLTSSPNLFTCDDHEFWNAFPEKAPTVPSTWRSEWRATNGRVAKDLFRLYQTASNPDGKSWFRFEIDPVSFFVSDSRSERTSIRSDDPHFFAPDQWAALEAWAEELRGPGVLVLGQPLFADKKSLLDPALQNFEGDFARLCRVFETAIRGGSRGESHDVVILTGDIHRARHFRGTLAGVSRAAGVHELVSSAASRIRMGPELRKPKVEDKGLTFSVGQPGHPLKWEAVPVAPHPPHELPSADNNVAVVRMAPATRAADTGAQQVRFTFAVWSLRPFTPAWTRAVPWRRPRGSLVKLYETEIVLR